MMKKGFKRAGAVLTLILMAALLCAACLPAGAAPLVIPGGEAAKIAGNWTLDEAT